MEELFGHNREIENALFNKYREIRSEKGDVCDDCNRSIKILNEGHPVSFFVVGENFQRESYKLCFVGKTVQSGWETDPTDPFSGFIDARKSAKEILFLPFWATYSFWQCIKEICRVLWKTSNAEDIWRKIAITNLVKCSASENRDQTPNRLKVNCIFKARFFEEEVKIIKPSHIIFFTGSDYDELIEKINFGFRYKDVTSNKYLKNLGPSFKALWWHRKFFEKGKVKMQFLRTYHPGYIKKQSQQECFSHKIAEWIEHNQ